MEDNSGNKILTIPDYDTNELARDSSGNICSILKVYSRGETENDDDVPHTVKIIEVISSTELKIEYEDEEDGKLLGELFVYGQEVDDKRALIKDKIFTVGISALQEVDRQQQADKARIATLETQVADLLARVSSLESS